MGPVGRDASAPDASGGGCLPSGLYDVTVTYLGETGLATTIRIAPPYDEPETGPCIERVVRRHPVGRFTATDWETGFVWDPSEE